MECEEIGHQEEQMEISTDNREKFENFKLFGNSQMFITENLLTIYAGLLDRPELALPGLLGLELDLSGAPLAGWSRRLGRVEPPEKLLCLGGVEEVVGVVGGKP